MNDLEVSIDLLPLVEDDGGVLILAYETQEFFHVSPEYLPLWYLLFCVYITVQYIYVYRNFGKDNWPWSNWTTFTNVWWGIDNKCKLICDITSPVSCFSFSGFCSKLLLSSWSSVEVKCSTKLLSLSTSWEIQVDMILLVSLCLPLNNKNLI